MGVDMAPVAVPSWYDMVPDSPFLRSLYAQPLPRATRHFLMFSYRGSFKLVGGENTDGTVSLSSQLSEAAQKAADRVIGFDETHTSVLTSGTVAVSLNEFLMQRASELNSVGTASVSH